MYIYNNNKYQNCKNVFNKPTENGLKNIRYVTYIHHTHAHDKLFLDVNTFPDVCKYRY